MDALKKITKEDKMKQVPAKEVDKVILAECERVGLDGNKMKAIVKKMKQLVLSSNEDQLATLIAFQIAMLQNSRLLLHQKLKLGIWTPPKGGKNGLIKPKS